MGKGLMDKRFWKTGAILLALLAFAAILIMAVIKG